MNIELDRIYNMDCLEGMKAIPDGSVDAVICDLPYGVLDTKGEHTKWDSVIPFDKLWEQYKRICKPTAAIVLFGQGMFTSDLMQSNRKMWRYNLIWYKPGQPSGFLNAPYRPLRNHEDIVVFYQKQPTYNPQFGVGDKSHIGKNPKTSHNRAYGTIGIVRTAATTRKHPISVLSFNRPAKDVIHPTQKPVDLLRYLVLTYTNEGDTVLDNCMGSGTTAIACIKEKRHFIGFELSKEYFDKAVRRIKAEQAQLTLF